QLDEPPPPVRPISSAPSFFLSARRPPGSTLFPYTTLFRSTRRGDADRPGHAVATLLDQLTRWGSARKEARRAQPYVPERRTMNEDRKSTRLNSSHVKISYAVFCLKKKTNTITTSAQARRKM